MDFTEKQTVQIVTWAQSSSTKTLSIVRMDMKKNWVHGGKLHKNIFCAIYLQNELFQEEILL